MRTKPVHGWLCVIALLDNPLPLYYTALALTLDELHISMNFTIVQSQSMIPERLVLRSVPFFYTIAYTADVKVRFQPGAFTVSLTDLPDKCIGITFMNQ